MLLLIDTAFDLCQVGLWHNNQLIASESAPGEARHDVILAPLVETLLQKNKTKVADLSGIAVMTGPGRFTSLRVGIAFARALVLPTGLPLYGVATSAVLHSYAEHHHKDWQKPAIIMAVKRGEVFIQTTINTDPVSIPLDHLATALNAEKNDGLIAIGAGIPDEWQATLPDLPHNVLSHLPLEAMGQAAARLHDTGAGHAVVRPFYGLSTGAGF